MHSDTSHKEKLIATLILKQDSSCTRSLVFESKSSPKIRVEIFLKAGDMYIMDDIVQQTFKHGVPSISYKGTLSSDERVYGQRMVVVFRYGVQRYFRSDSGVPVNTLEKTNVSYNFGHPKNLKIGDLRTRVQLQEQGHHGHIQRGIYGNQYSGVKSIVLSVENKHNFIESDESLHYQCTLKNGARSFITSSQSKSLQKTGIRVFMKDKKNTIKSALYRYCGLFRVTKTTRVASNSNIYNFILRRIQKRRRYTVEEHKLFVRRLRYEFGGNITLAAKSMGLLRQNLSYLNDKY